MSCTCDTPFEDCPHAMIFPNRDKWYCDKTKLKKSINEPTDNVKIERLTKSKNVNKHFKFGFQLNGKTISEIFIDEAKNINHPYGKP